jgi:hypothetical protein
MPNTRFFIRLYRSLGFAVTLLRELFYNFGTGRQHKRGRSATLYLRLLAKTQFYNPPLIDDYV